MVIKEYQTINKDEIKIRRNEEYENTKDLKRIYDINYPERNGENIQIYKKNSFQNNKEELYKKIKKRKDEYNNFRLACNLRERVLNAFNAQNVWTANKTLDLLGCSHYFLRHWIESQLYDEMILENYGKIWCLDHCLAVASSNLLDENDMKNRFNWINLGPMYKKDDINKGDKIDMRLYLLQEMKAYQFLSLYGREG